MSDIWVQYTAAVDENDVIGDPELGGNGTRSIAYRIVEAVSTRFAGFSQGQVLSLKDGSPAQLLRKEVEKRLSHDQIANLILTSDHVYVFEIFRGPRQEFSMSQVKYVEVKKKRVSQVIFVRTIPVYLPESLTSMIREHRTTKTSDVDEV